MKTSSNGYILRVTGPLWGESIGHRWIPLTKASDAELWCFVLYAPEQTFEQTIKTQVVEKLRAHYDVTVMISQQCKYSHLWHYSKHQAGDITTSHNFRMNTITIFSCKMPYRIGSCSFNKIKLFKFEFDCGCFIIELACKQPTFYWHG